MPDGWRHVKQVDPSIDSGLSLRERGDLRSSRKAGIGMKGLARLSIASLTASICYVALGSPRRPGHDPFYGRLWDDAYFMVTIFILAGATIMAVLSQGQPARWLDSPSSARSICSSAGPTPADRRESPGTYRPRFPHATLINWVLVSSTCRMSHISSRSWTWPGPGSRPP